MSHHRRGINPNVVWMLIGTGLLLIGMAGFTALLRADVAAVFENSPGVLPMRVEYPAPDLRLTDLTGAPVALSEHLGQVVLVNLWATWCPPCKAEMPTLQGYYEDHHADGFVIVAISDGDPVDAVVDFVEEYGLTFPVWPDLTYKGTAAFRTDNLPSSFVIDRQGVVRLAWIGEITRANLERYVTPMIEEGLK